MMVRNVYLVLLVNIFNTYLEFATAETTVDVSTPINSVAVGGILVVQCQIWNIQNGDTVAIARTSEEGSEQISNSESITKSSVENRVYLSIRTFPDGSSVYFLTLLDASLEDTGNYVCSVTRISGLLPSVISHDSIDVQIYSYPDKSQPYCSGSPPSVMLSEGNTLELTCTTYKTVPTVVLKWRSLSTYQYLQSPNLSQGDTVVSRLYITIGKLHHGAIFRCEMTSLGFRDRMQSCEIGPMSIQFSSDTADSDDGLTTRTSKEIINVDIVNPITTIGDCRNVCTSFNTVFYLTVSTAATSLLAFIFFITTIVMCCKYHNNVSFDVRRNQRYVPTPPSQVSDPVYVSLSRCNTNERVYMTLEDPNNPEGKVLLPKEVFDEFYNRTLTLKKT